MKWIVHVGLDVHKDSITYAVLEEGERQAIGTRRIGNDLNKLRNVLKKYSEGGHDIKVCYEAGPGGYTIYRALKRGGYRCEVIAPSETPRRPGQRRKTDKLDAKKLVDLYKSGQLTAIHVPSEDEERDRSIVRCRERFSCGVRQTKNRIVMFLQSRGIIYRDGTYWTKRYRSWLNNLELAASDRYVLDKYLSLLDYQELELRDIEDRISQLAREERYLGLVEKLGCLKGIGLTSAMVLLTEIFDFRRFSKAKEFMDYLGLSVCEKSSGEREHRGGITKTGNSYCRRVLIEAAWKYLHRPGLGGELKRRLEKLPSEYRLFSKKVQIRLYKKFWRLAAKKPKPKAVTAVARELAGAVWALMQEDVRLAEENVM